MENSERDLRLRISSSRREAGRLAPPDASWEVTEYYTDARLTSDGERVSLIYSEDSTSGLDRTDTEISFSVSEPSRVTVTRRGDRESSMEFSPRVRSMCIYDTGVFPIEMSIITKEVTNSFSMGVGEIGIDYFTEMQGCGSYHIKINISAV